MEILPCHYYQMIMRAGGSQRAGRCFNLRVQELSPEESSQHKVVVERDASEPTHMVAFHDFENIRTYVGWLKEDSEDRLVFWLGGVKEYEFRPLDRPS